MSRAPESLRHALEREAHQVAGNELGRRRGVLGSIPAAEREAVSALTHRVAEDLVDLLLVEAQRDERLAYALRSALFDDGGNLSRPLELLHGSSA